MTGSTGHRCPQSGIWQGSDTCREQIALSYNEVFPPCKCGRGVTWSLVRATS